MHPESQVIFFGAELIHPPQMHTEEALREFYLDLSKVRYCGCDYRQFRLTPDGAEMMTADGNLRSTCLVKADRLHLSEDWTRLSLDEFCARAQEVAKRYMEMLHARVFVVQSAAVRALMTPSGYADARVFLAERVCRLEAEREIFPAFEGRPVHMFGLRLMLPPTDEETRRFNIRIESFNRDTSRVFVEVSSESEGTPVTEESLEAITENIRRAFTIATSNVLSFLDRFDVKPESER